MLVPVTHLHFIILQKIITIIDPRWLV